MKPTPPPQRRSIRVDLTLPVTRIGFGPFSFDPLEQLIGAPIADILDSLLAGEVRRRPSASGPAVDVYPLELPDGEGACVPLGQFGEVGFHNDRGLLVLTAPLPMKPWLVQRLGSAMANAPVDDVSSDGTSRVVRCWVRLRPGMQAALPIAGLGEIALEAA